MRRTLISILLPSLLMLSFPTRINGLDSKSNKSEVNYESQNKELSTNSFYKQFCPLYIQEIRLLRRALGVYA